MPSDEQSPARLYLDNAATSWPKPPEVYEATDRFQRHCGAGAGRGCYSAANEAESIVRRTRQQIAELIGCRDDRQVIFTHNGTDSLNLAIQGSLQSGDHVVTTTAEHNSVLRPLNYLQAAGVIELTVVPANERGWVEPALIQAAFQSNTRMVCLIHASNVSGIIQPIDAIAEMTRKQGALFLLDAAQTLGKLDIDVENQSIDFLAAPGHKGLLGPLGTGVLYVSPQASASLRPLRFGGTGTQSHQADQPEELPERLESGNLNVVGLAGLSAGVSFLSETGLATIRHNDHELMASLHDQLSPLTGVEWLGPSSPELGCGVVSLSLTGRDPREVCLLLDQAFGIQTRAGFHCAPLIHQSLGTSEQGGSLRISTGPFNVPGDADRFAAALHELLAST